MKLPLTVVFLGAPGAGKGTQARVLSGKYGIPHVSTGDILREAIKLRTPLGLEAQKKMDAGELVTDETVCLIVEERLRRSDCSQGFILDGFPRTISQAERLSEMLPRLSFPMPIVFHINAGQEELIKRLTGRRTCSVCRQIYNIHGQRPRIEGQCDVCGGRLELREDDKLEVIQGRFTEYTNQTQPLIQYYRERGLLFEINGAKDIRSINLDILSLIKSSKVLSN